MIGGTERRGGQAALRDRLRHEQDGEVDPRPDQEGDRRPSSRISAPYHRPAATAPRAASSWPTWLTSKDNPYFARSYVNRLWGYLLGAGIIEPLDDIRAGNPPSNPELLDYLTDEFVKSGFDARHVMRLICKSRTYQLSVETNKWNADDKINYSHATGPPAAGRGAARRGLPRDRLGLEDPGRAGRAPARRRCPTRAWSCPAAS